MRIGVRHETHYHYDAPPTGVIQTLRLTPRNHEGQFVLDWRIEVSADCRLDEQEDAFGNIIHAFKYDGRRSLANPLAGLMRQRCAQALADADALVPLPLHPSRRRTRG